VTVIAAMKNIGTGEPSADWPAGKSDGAMSTAMRPLPASTAGTLRAVHASRGADADGAYAPVK